MFNTPPPPLIYSLYIYTCLASMCFSCNKFFSRKYIYIHTNPNLYLPFYACYSNNYYSYGHNQSQQENNCYCKSCKISTKTTLLGKHVCHEYTIHLWKAQFCLWSNIFHVVLEKAYANGFIGWFGCVVVCKARISNLNWNMLFCAICGPSLAWLMTLKYTMSHINKLVCLALTITFYIYIYIYQYSYIL